MTNSWPELHHQWIGSRLATLLRPEDVAFGLELLGSGEPAYSPPSSSTSQSTQSNTSSIPNDIQGEGTLLLDGRTTLHFALTPEAQRRLQAFNTGVPSQSAKVQPITWVVHLSQWQQRSNKQPCRSRTVEKQDEFFIQCDEFKDLNVCQDSSAEFYIQVHLTSKPHQAFPCTNHRDIYY